MGEEIKTEETKDNTEVTEEKTLAETMYSEDDKGQESEQDKEETSDDEEAKAEETTEEETKEEGEESKDDESKDDDTISYEDFTVPEGFGEVTEEAVELFKDSKLSQEDAQKFVDYGVKIQQDTLDGVKATHENTVKEWGETVEKDLKAELPKAVEFVGKICSDEECKFLDDSGLGNHPVMVKMMAKLADFSGEDFMLKEESTATAKKEVSLAEAMYPNAFKK